jgi:hypothetical protein
MDFKFVIRDDINVRARSLIDSKYKDYTKEDISRAVAFYLDLILDSKYEKIAVGFGNLSLLSVAFMLALHKSGKDYTLVYHDGTFNFFNQPDLYSHLFFTGVASSEEGQGYSILNALVRNAPGKITFTDTQQTEQAAFSYHKKDDLIFDYSKNKKISYIIGDDDSLIYTTEKIEGSSIDAAMKHYYHEDDYAVIMRPFQHFGVGTLSVYPAFFKAKNISLCPFADDWEQEYHKATHVHIDPHMMKIGCKLPSKLRMLTSGGYNFNSDCIEYVTSRSQIENIVDCFGTVKCPPPLAIRRLPGNTSFQWINEFIRPSTIEDTKQLVFTSVEENVFTALPQSVNNCLVTEDLVEFSDDMSKFSITGKLVDKIRMSHILYSPIIFKNLFSKCSGIDFDDVELQFEIIDGLKNPVIYVKEKDFAKANEAISLYNVEAKLKTK